VAERWSRVGHGRRESRLGPLIFVLLSLAATALLTTCATGAGASTVDGAVARAVKTATLRAKMRTAHPVADTSLYRVKVTPASLSDMMQQDLAANQAYLAWVRSSQGDAAAARIEDAVRLLYQRRIDQMRSLNVDHQDFDIQVVTVWGSLTFSTRSYDDNFGPMDPVSLLFTGNGSSDSVYLDMVAAPACPATQDCQAPAFQDDKGTNAQGTGFVCQSQTQWVLMGNAGDELRWRPSTRGVMRSGDRCAQGVRDHMRIFGGPASAVFGDWSVATPHQEAWADAPGRFGHTVQSWTAARVAIAGFWDSFGGAATTNGVRTPALSLGNGGYYQNVEFDGRGIAVEICPCP
jgi:hypothetical protein